MSSQEFKDWQISDKHDENGHKEAANRAHETNFSPPVDYRPAIVLTFICLRIIDDEFELVNAQKCWNRAEDGKRVADKDKKGRMGESSMFSIYTDDG